MVRAILDGRKTQTRRIVKPQPVGTSVTHNNDRTQWFGWEHGITGEALRCPYGVPGDRLWVREAWRAHVAADTIAPRNLLHVAWDDPDKARIAYEEDPSALGTSSWAHRGRYRPSIHMPRWASRITLEVTDVRVQRLNDISEEDAMAEGVRRVTKDGMTEKFCVYDKGDYSSTPWAEMPRRPRDVFAGLWESINGPGAWDANPWVWTITFKRVTP